VTVQVLSTAFDGSYDTQATAIIRDSTGTVVLDAQVDMFGEAAATLPSGSGSLTVIQFDSSGTEILHSYRGLVTSNFVVVNSAPSTSGRSDLMLANFTPPAHAGGISMLTECGGGSWSSGTGPVYATLTFYDGCRTPTFSMLSTVGFVDAEPRQFVWQTGLTHTPNGNVALATNWAPLSSAMVTLANVPSSSPTVNVVWSTLLGAQPLKMGNQQIGSPTAGDQTITLAGFAPGAGDGVVVDVQTFTSLLASESRQVVQTSVTNAITVDFAAQPIPLVSGVQQNATGTSWTQTSGTADVRNAFWDATLHSGVRVHWFLTEPNDGQSSTTMPSLPPAHAAQDPTADPQATLHGTFVGYIDYDVVNGFTLTPPVGSHRTHSCVAQTFTL
jgi:hypothetical protein